MSPKTCVSAFIFFVCALRSPAQQGPQVLSPEVSADRHVTFRIRAGGAADQPDGTALLTVQDIGPGDAVITSPYTFFATAGCIARTRSTAYRSR